MYKKTMREALKEARAYRDPIDEGITGNIQKAITIAKKMGGNMTGAIKEIEKIARGLSNHPDVANALRRANEELEEALEVKWDSNKQGWFDKQAKRRYLGIGQTNALMKRHLTKQRKQVTLLIHLK